MLILILILILLPLVLVLVLVLVSVSVLVISISISIRTEVKGAGLTDSEMVRGRADFKTIWDSMPDKSNAVAVYDQYKEDHAARRARKEPPRPYKTTWGGGCSATPIAPMELFSFITTCGWPTDDDIFDKDGVETRVAADWNTDFNEDEDQIIWSLGRAPRNVNRDLVRCPKQFELVEKGICNFIAHISKEVADIGEKVICIKGVCIGNSQRHQWFLGQLSGTMYSPKVFDLTRIKFTNPDHEFVDELPLPVLCQCCQRANRAVQTYQALDSETSDEFIDTVTDSVSTMWLFDDDYIIPLSIDGSMVFTEIRGLRPVGNGPLWTLGMREPLLHHETRSDDISRNLYLCYPETSGLAHSNPTNHPGQRILKHDIFFRMGV